MERPQVLPSYLVEASYAAFLLTRVCNLGGECQPGAVTVRGSQFGINKTVIAHSIPIDYFKCVY